MNILNKNNIISYLLLFHFFEIAFFGSGRLLEFGPLTLRMYCFIFVIFLTIFHLNKFNYSILFSVFIFLLSLILSSIIGIAKNNQFEIIFDHIKPLLLFLEIILIYYFIGNQNKTEISFYYIYKYIGLILSLVFFILLILIYLKLIDFTFFYEWTLNENDFIFRSQENQISTIGFFYKGFLYLGVSFFFFLFDKKKYSNLSLIIILIALILTLTRGLILSTLFTYLIYLFKGRKTKAFLYIILLFIIIYSSYNFYINLLGNREESNSIRIDDFHFVLNNLSFLNIFFGNGFGSLINNRVGVENSFLDIFFNQGLLGILLYVYIFIRILLIHNKKLKNNNFYSPFYYGTIFIYIESFTNPFINNPIGMSFVIVTFAIFEKNNISSSIKEMAYD